MAIRILDATTRAAVNAAATQQAQAEALIAAWAGANVRRRYYAGETLLRTQTIAAWTINGSTPRGVVEAAGYLADTSNATGTPTRVVYSVIAGADIFEADCSISAGGATVDFPNGAIKALCPPVANGVVYTMWAGLPVGGGTTALSTLAGSMAAGEWAELTVTGLTTGMFVYVPNGNNCLDYMDKAAYDPVLKQVRFIGQAHVGDMRWFQYDETTNNFSTLADPPWDPGGSGYPGYLGHGYQHNTIDPATGDDYYHYTNSGDMQRRDRSGSTWVEVGGATTSGNGISGAIEWLPSIGTQGGIVRAYADYVQRWDKAANSWSTVTSSLANPGDHRFAARSIPNNLVLFGGGNGSSTQLWSVGASGGITSRTACPIGMGVTLGITACCPTSGDLLVFGTSSARQYDVAGDSWSTLTLTGAPTFPTINSGHKVLAVPVPAYGVVMFILGGSADVWIYKHAV